MRVLWQVLLLLGTSFLVGLLLGDVIYGINAVDAKLVHMSDLQRADLAAMDVGHILRGMQNAPGGDKAVNEIMHDDR